MAGYYPTPTGHVPISETQPSWFGWPTTEDGGEESGDAVATHESAADPHSQYLDETDGDARYLQSTDADDMYVLQVGGEIRGYLEPVDPLGTSGTITLDLSTHSVFEIDPTGAVDFAFSGLPSAGDTRSATIIIRNDSHAITWPSGTRFAGGDAPELDGETWLVVVAVGSQVTVLVSAAAVA